MGIKPPATIVAASASAELLALLSRVRQLCGSSADIAPLIDNPDELSALVNGVKISFVRYPFPTLYPFVTFEGVSLLSVTEIAATKAYTIGQRGLYKDYVDLYFVFSEGRSTLPRIIADTERKFGTEFNARLFLERLVYFDDLDDTEIQYTKGPVAFETIETFFEERVREAGGELT